MRIMRDASLYDFICLADLRAAPAAHWMHSTLLRRTELKFAGSRARARAISVRDFGRDFSRRRPCGCAREQMRVRASEYRMPPGLYMFIHPPNTLAAPLRARFTRSNDTGVGNRGRMRGTAARPSISMLHGRFRARHPITGLQVVSYSQRVFARSASVRARSRPPISRYRENVLHEVKLEPRARVRFRGLREIAQNTAFRFEIK